MSGGQAENVIHLLDQLRGHLLAALGGNVQAQFAHRCHRVGAGRLAVHRRQPGRQRLKASPLPGQFAKETFSHRAATDVARADEEYFFHALIWAPPLTS